MRAYELLLLEDQRDYLTRKYPDVDPRIIDRAIAIDRRSAEKLVFGLTQGVIADLTDGDAALAAVQDLNPLAKASNKSEEDLAYEALIKRAKQLNERYWQWIVRVWKLEPDTRIEPDLFDFLPYSGWSDKEILGKSLEEVREASDTWHREQVSVQKTGKTYRRGIDDPEAIRVGDYWWVPVDKLDASTEGERMQNCIGSACNPSDRKMIWSCRNSLNNPHVSVEVSFRDRDDSNSWVVGQIRGKQNQVPLPRYVPLVLQLIDHFKEWKFETYSDLWNLPGAEEFVRKYLNRVIDPMELLERRPGLFDDETVNKLLLKVQEISSYTDPDNIVPRLTPEVTQHVIRNVQVGTKWILSAIKHHKLPKESAIELLQNANLGRNAELMIRSVYDPDIFVKELRAIHPQDVLAALKNYSSALEIYNGERDSAFTNIIRALPAVHTDGHRSASLVNCLKHMPKQDLAALLGDDDVLQSLARFGQVHPVSKILDAMNSNVLVSDLDAKVQFLAALPTEKAPTRNSQQSDYLTPGDIFKFVYTTPPEQWPQLLDALKRTSLKNGLQSIADHVQKLHLAHIGKPVKPGLRMPEDKLHLTQVVSMTDDPAELRKLYTTTKRPTLRKRIERKLSRLARLEAAGNV